MDYQIKNNINKELTVDSTFATEEFEESRKHTYILSIYLTERFYTEWNTFSWALI